MNKILLALFLILFPLFVFSQSHQINSVVIRRCGEHTSSGHYKAVDSIDLNGLLVSTTSWYDTLGAPGSRQEFTYSPTKKLLHDMRCNYINSVCFTESDKTWQYNNSDSLISYINLHASYGNVYSGYGDFYSYDSLNRMTEYVYKKFIDSLNILVNRNRDTFTHDTINHTITELLQNYIDSSGSWLNKVRRTNYLDNTGKKFKIIVEEWISPGIFIYDYTLFYYYLPNNSIDHISEIGNASGDSTVTQYLYAGAGYLTKISKGSWSGGTMNFPISVTNYFYDTNQNMIASGTSYWQSPMLGWERCDTTINNYDIENRLITYYHTALGSCGRGGQSSWYAYSTTGVLDSSNHCEWTMGTNLCTTCSFEHVSLVSGISSQLNEAGINIFPNPASDEITISLKRFNQPITFVIRDNFGRQIKTGKIENEKSTLSISDLSPGIYFLNVMNDSENLTSRKFIVE